MMGRYAAALSSEPLDSMVKACLSPSRRPVGRLVLLAVDGLLHFVDADAAGRELVGIHLHAHGILLRAVHLHARDAADHGDALRHQGLGVLVDRVHGQRGRKSSAR